MTTFAFVLLAVVAAGLLVRCIHLELRVRSDQERLRKLMFERRRIGW